MQEDGEPGQLRESLFQNEIKGSAVLGLNPGYQGEKNFDLI